MLLHDDPLLRRWAIDTIGDTLFVSESRRQSIADSVFSDTALSELLGKISEDEIGSLIRDLPDDRWVNHIGFLVERWPGWQGTTARTAASLIARHRPVEAAGMFEFFITGIVEGGEPDRDRLMGVIGALRYLGRDQAHGILTKLMSVLGDGQRLELTGWQLAIPAEAAMMTGHPDRLDIVRRWLDRMATEGDRPLQDALVRLGEWLFGDASQVGFVRDVVMGYSRQSVAPLIDLAFRPDVSLVEIDNALRGLRLDDGRTAARLLQHHLDDRSGGDETPERWGDFVALVRGRIPQPVGRPVKHVWTEVLGLGGILTALRLPRLDMASAGLETIWTVVAADLDLPPGLETALPVLRNAPHGNVVERLIAIAKSDSHAGRHAAILMGLLEYEEFLPGLIAGLEWEFEDAQEAVVSALERFGDRAIAVLDQRFGEVDGYGQLMALAVASRLGGETAATFIVRHFTMFVDVDANALAEVITVLDAEPLNTELADWLDEDVPDLNWAYVVLAKRHGRAGDPGIQDLVSTVERWEAERAKRRVAAVKGLLPGLDEAVLPLPLACRTCGHMASYPVGEVWVTADPADLKPFLAEDIACTKCGAVSHFDFTPEARTAIADEAKRIGLGDLEVHRFREPWSAVKVRPLQGPAGLQRSVTDVIQEFEDLLVANPNDAARHRSVANLYLDTNRYAAAEEHFRRCREIDPAYLEAHYGLAQVTERRGNVAQAIDHLLEGVKYGGAMACRRPEGWATPAEFVADYIGLYHEMAGNDSSRPKLLPTMFRAKLGRNDPCPLGTGKKVKKCCGGGN